MTARNPRNGTAGSYRQYQQRFSPGVGSKRVLEASAMVLHHMFSALSFLQYRQDDDFVDRMSYFYTSSFLIMMAVLVSFKQFGGRPLECWVPAEFTHSWEAYTEMYCWAQNTYFVPFEDDIPIDIAYRESMRISYYQWVPFFLLIEALMFYFPCLIWRLMNDKSGIRLHDIVNVATEKENIDGDFRAKTVESLAKHTEACLKYQHAIRNRSGYTLHRVFKCLNLRYYESYVTGLYLFVKLLYIGNVMGNLFLMNTFLETHGNSIYGFAVLKDLLEGKNGWNTSGNFPRVTLCDFEVRVLGNLQRHTVQCVLVINIFTEKIFILLWLWFSFLFVVTVMDALYWFSISVRTTDRLRFIMRHLELTSNPKRFHKKHMREKVRRFLTHYIKVDGIFILRMLAVHAGVMFCTELIESLWLRFLAKLERERGAISSESEEDVEPERLTQNKLADALKSTVSMPMVFGGLEDARHPCSSGSMGLDPGPTLLDPTRSSLTTADIAEEDHSQGRQPNKTIVKDTSYKSF